MKRIGIVALALLVLLVTGGLFRHPQAAFAQDKKNGAAVTIKCSNDLHNYYAALLQSGKVIRSGSAGIVTDVRWQDVPEGDYELHIEAKGYDTRIMPVHIVVSDINVYSSESEKGDGVLYFGKTPSMQQLLARIEKLEAAIKVP